MVVQVSEFSMVQAAFAAAVIRPASAPGQVADRQWLAGVYACEAGMANDGKALLTQAAQSKDEYKSELPLFGAGG